MAKVFIEDTSLTAIGDAIRSKTGSTELMSPSAMATAIEGITGGGCYNIPDSEFLVTGDCSYKYYNDNYYWLLESYGNKISTQNISDARNMFSHSSVIEIPFDINLNGTAQTNCEYMFCNCWELESIPYVKGVVSDVGNMFDGCWSINSIPEDWNDNIDWSYLHSYQYAKLGNLFSNCHSLRKIPSNLMSNLWSINASWTSYLYYYGFRGCFVLDELIDIPVQQTNITYSSFSCTFDSCTRLKELTFAQVNGGVNWKNQTINLGLNVGYTSTSSYVTSYNSGLTESTRITDANSYQRLKDNKDSWTTDIAYSRYNRDSAVRTLASLPDTSEYIAANGGTNTIKFKGASGSATDGGAVNTMTSAQIAVATAKGWTVSFV